MKLRLAGLFGIALSITLTFAGAARAADEPADPIDEGWPRVFEKADQRVVIHQPQIESWENHLRMAARSAVAVTAGKGEKPIFGVISMKAPTVVDHDARTVLIKKPDTEIRFPNTDAVKAASLEKLVREVLPNKESMVLSLDRAVALMSDQAKSAREVAVKLDPPTIFYSDSPAILVNFIGKPQFKPIKETSLMAAVNTNWDMFLDGKTSKYYLLKDESWLSAADPMKGPWLIEKSAPADIANLPNDENWKAARNAVPGRKITKAPRVFTSEAPAELILTEGKPAFTPISGTRLMLVSNTDSRLVFFPQEKNYYFSVAGRWFRANDLNGPWSAATTSLPDEFAKIPADGEALSDIRASVPGTEEAEDAVLLAETPQTAEVKKTATVEIIYDEDPKFKPIEGTEALYAVNTRYQVFQVGKGFYCCYQGVWFESGSPKGPWTVCAEVPQAIYAIPVTHPAHNVTYVRVFDSAPDRVVVGYTSGYRGEYVSSGVLVFGAGMIIIDEDDDDYDIYYLYPTPYYSYGAGAIYDWRHGGYYRAATAYGPYGGAGRGGYYNPYTGGWARGAYMYGPLGGTYARHGYNPYTDTYKAQAGGSNIYGSWGRTYVERDDEWLRAGHRATGDSRVGWTVTSNESGAVRVETDNRQGVVARDDDGNIYVGNDDHFYRRDDDGEWSRREDGDWETVDRPEPSRDELKRRESGEPSTLPADTANRPKPADSIPPSTLPAETRRPRPADRQAQSPVADHVRAQPGSDFYWQLDSQASARSRGERNVNRAQRTARPPAGARPARGRR